MTVDADDPDVLPTEMDCGCTRDQNGRPITYCRKHDPER